MKSQEPEAHFLMAEDNPADIEFFKEMLASAVQGNYQVHCVDKFEKLEDILSNNQFEALILDMNLPDQSGIENIHRIVERYPSLPIIILTAQEDIDLALNSLHCGAQDYLTKNKVNPEILMRSLRYAKERKKIELELRDALTQAAIQNSQLETIAKYDNLTGLPNRAYFHDTANHVLERVKRSNKQCALLYVDLDNFKRVNDAFGHMFGDELLKRVAKRLSQVVRASDLLARLSGDEFVILTDILESPARVYPLVNRINDNLNEVFIIDEQEVITTPSIGVAYFPAARDIDELIRHADRAMYEAKRKLQTTTCFYTPKMAERYSRRQQIEREIPLGLEKDEFETWFQPIFFQAKPEIAHMEALMRWHSAILNWVSPGEFIPIAETSTLINSITELSIRDGAKVVRDLQEHKISIGHLAINICVMQLSNPAFCPILIRWLRNNDLSPEKICLEITERQIIQNADICATHIKNLRDFGIKFSLDDFGSGFSSITHLLDLPIDILKLDRKLIDHIDLNERNQALTAGIVEMAHRLNMQVVAEGIERTEEFEFMTDLGVDFIQGFGYAKPMHLEKVMEFFHSH